MTATPPTTPPTMAPVSEDDFLEAELVLLPPPPLELEGFEFDVEEGNTMEAFVKLKLLRPEHVVSDEPCVVIKAVDMLCC